MPPRGRASRCSGPTTTQQRLVKAQMPKPSCSEILEEAYRVAASHLKQTFVADAELARRIASVALCLSNRAGARFLLAATLAKIDKPNIDIRKPFIQAYPATKKADAYGGRN